MYDLDNDDNDPDGGWWLRHNANTVNNDSDDDGYDDDDDNDGAPSDGAGTVDATDDCGNEHVDKAQNIFFEHAWLLITVL